MGIALTAASILFLLGTLAYVAAMLRTREVPPVPLVLCAIGTVPIALRAFGPEVVLDLGLAVLAVGIACLAIWLFGRSNRIVNWTITGTPPREMSPADPRGRGRAPAAHHTVIDATLVSLTRVMKEMVATP